MSLTPSPTDAADASAPTESRAVQIALGTLSVLLVALFYALCVIRNFDGPIGDYSESFLYEYLPWFASRHLSFWPIPHLSLHTDEVLYPFGGNVALQSWCVEREILFALLKSRAPQAPLLQLYYLFGVALSTLGTYLLLLVRFGSRRAALTTVIAHALNFYSMQKYAYHYNIACYHWTTLGIVCDFAIVWDVVQRRNVSLRLVLLRILLLVLAFGLELGHVLGFSLTSFACTSLYLLWFLYRGSRPNPVSLRQLLSGWPAELRSHRVLFGILALLTICFAWLYGSITAAIVWDSLSMGRFPGNSGVWWASPLRLLIPYTPWLHPSMQPPFLHVMGDVAETGIGGGSAGLFLLLLCGIGSVQVKAYRPRSPYFPLLVMLILYVATSIHLPLLRALPWFRFCRVYSRATLVYSTIMALLAVEISLPKGSLFRRLSALLSLSAIAIVELVTIVQIKRAHPTYTFDPSQRAYFDTLKKLPGEAVLDFPFCLTGGNGDLGGLCPYWQRAKGVYALSRFHEKKVIGQYLGRIHPSQVAPFVRQGWDELFDPDQYDMTRATRQKRCLTDAEWTFFTAFYLRNDFAAIQLAIDLLPPGCAEQFYAHFGQPIARMTLMNAGTLVLIPKPAEQRALVDKELGKQVSLVRTDPGQLSRHYTAQDLQRSDEHAISIRSDDHGQPTIFEFQPGVEATIFGPYVTLPAGLYEVRFDLELTKPATGTIAQLDLVGGLGTDQFGQLRLDASQLANGRTQITFPAKIPAKSSRIEVRLENKGAGLRVHQVTVHRLGPIPN